MQADEVIATTFLSAAKLQAFYEAQVLDAKAKGVLFSLHLKATMMKVSDPILFGHAVSAYYKDVFAKHADTLKQLGVNTAQRLRRSARQDSIAAGRPEGRHRSRHQGGV